MLKSKKYKEGNQNIYQTVQHVPATEKEPRLSEAISKVHSSSTQGDPQGCRRQFDKNYLRVRTQRFGENCAHQ